jgi:hypothetical protein
MAGQATHWFSGKRPKMFAVVDKNTNRVVEAVFAETAEDITKEYPMLYGVEMTLENSPAGINFIWNGKQFLSPTEQGVK